MPKVNKRDLEELGFVKSTDGYLYHYGDPSYNTHLHLGAYGSGYKPLDIQYLSAKFDDQGIGNFGYSAVTKQFKTYKLDEVQGHAEAVDEFRRVIDKLNKIVTN
ncbi:hypothetical protein SAMN02745121_04593 [Nannocystis exedens]|uniref:Uncharacterized protein n=1 Tax=Nannocystis exedens TaxID=54 RepID=A0A1I2BCM1_9BACT|nr:hypothetical protein [Nannocystis exedens]PCC68064.1 hypothetical protein NAEX_01072 [Nannocystis exedens]SFE53638.1 hypothetical protein SAMN02745121_04593 [Nannocystis exedens]